jgi:alpha-galactosidase
VTQICPCGTPPTFSLLPYMDQAVTADPTSSVQIRQRIKFYKALLGPGAAVFADHIELSDGSDDFASEIGAGGIPATKFVWPEDPFIRLRLMEWWGLTPEKQALWKRWMEIYRTHHLADGEYLNLYDLAYDKPEAHAIRKGQKLYFAFYTEHHDQEYQGEVSLRGLEQATYRLHDYAQDAWLGEARGPQALLKVQFQGSLLLEAIPTI